MKIGGLKIIFKHYLNKYSDADFEHLEAEHFRHICLGFQLEIHIYLGSVEQLVCQILSKNE